MTTWLGKLDPETCSIDDFEKSNVLLWKKVRHPKGMQNMGRVLPGDKILVYHSGEKAIAGVVEVVDNNPDPEHKQGRLINAKFIKKFSEPRIKLEDIKSSGKFDTYGLVREPRLSFMEVPEELLNTFNISL